uniref:RNA-binding protein 28 n=1 Tax=Globodera pallida TaxID=36090 RepID=A0A183BM60_GLOPA
MTKKCLNFTQLNGRKVAVDWALDKDHFITRMHEEKKSAIKEEEPALKTEPDEDATETSDVVDVGKGDEKLVKKEADEPKHSKREKKKRTLDDSAVTEGRVVFLSRPGIKQWRLIFRNLPFTTSEEDLREWAGTFGKIREIVLPKCADKRFPKSTAGFCFVQFSSRKDAENAKKCLNFTQLNGRKVAVDWALDKDHFITRMHEEKKSAIKDEEPALKTEPDEDANETSDVVDVGKGDEKLVKKEAVEPKHSKREKKKRTLDDSAVTEGRVVFLRNVPFSVDNEKLKTVAEEFGEVQLAILCRNKDTGDPAGTAFVHFREKESADNFLDKLITAEFSWRVGSLVDENPVKDKRNLYLLRASLVRPGTAQAKEMSEEDAKLRQRLMEVAKKKLINLVMFISPTRLVIHNIPFTLTDAQLKNVCLEAAGGCSPTSVSECRIMCQRTGEDAKGRAQLGKSKGFGFVAFTEHTLALKCLRNLNNNPETFTNERRPIVEFSVENLNALRTKERRVQSTTKSEDAGGEATKQRKASVGVENAEALDRTKRELMAGGKKWLPKKFGAKIRHKDRAQRAPSKKAVKSRTKDKAGNQKMKGKRNGSRAAGQPTTKRRRQMPSH